MQLWPTNSASKLKLHLLKFFSAREGGSEFGQCCVVNVIPCKILTSHALCLVFLASKMLAPVSVLAHYEAKVWLIGPSGCFRPREKFGWMSRQGSMRQEHGPDRSREEGTTGWSVLCALKQAVAIIFSLHVEVSGCWLVGRLNTPHA